MATDVSSFKDAYKNKVALAIPMPNGARLVFGYEDGTEEVTDYIPSTVQTRYGTNPHQQFVLLVPCSRELSVGNLEMLKGGKAGLSLTNIQDMSQALNTLKFFSNPSAIALKHLNPCGFQTTFRGDETPDSLYKSARGCDERSHFGAVVGFNYEVDKKTAEAIMETFVEVSLAPGYTDEALEVLRSNDGTKKLNNSIRVARYQNIDRIPRFVGDDIRGYWNIKTLVDGSMAVEVPYLTRIRSIEDFVTDPMIPNSKPEVNNGQDFVVNNRPTDNQLRDSLVAWYVNINTRSNGVVFVKDGRAIAVGTGEQERIGAVEKAIDKAVKKGHDLRGSVLCSDGFFPSRDCIDEASKYGVSGAVWPAGSIADAKVIEAANERGMFLAATLERCFAHF